MRDLSQARINLTGHVIEAINISIIESELKLPLKNASVNNSKLYTALSLKNWLEILSDRSGTQLYQLKVLTRQPTVKDMADRIRVSADANAYQLPSSSKPYLSFSIDNILSEGTFGPRNQQRKVHAQKYESSKKDKANKPSVETLLTRLPWLAYTRYCPPKIPRSKPRKGSRRHKLDRNPRIPFSSSQLAALEAKFIHTQYLSGSEVRDLSSMLRVTEHRVKIWFQNRRAREKKTQAASSEKSGSPQS